MHGEHLGRVLADLGARLGDHGQHDLVENLAAGVVGDVERVLDDLHRQTVVLQVHLDGGDALLCAADLEVHLAVEVLDALDVDEGGEAAVIVLNQAAADARDGGLDGHARVHQRQRGAADGALRRGAVGAEHLGDDANGIGELLDGRQHRQQRALGQRTVADLAAAGTAGGLGLADGIAGEVVVVHVALLRLLPDGVELLVGGEGVKRADGEHLRLAAGEQARAVDAGQHADLGGQRADLILGAAVHAVPLEQPCLDDLLLELIGDLVEVLVHVGIVLEEQLVPLLDQLVPAGLADVLVVGVHGGLRLVHRGVHDLLEQLLVEVGVGIVELGLADLGNHLVDQRDLLLVLLVGHADGLEHDVVGHLVGAGLDHDDLLTRGDDGYVEVADLALVAGGVEDELAVDQTDLQRGDGAVPGDVGDGERGGRTDQRGDLGGAVVVNGHDRAHDGHVVAEVVGEERADGAVDDAGGQDALLAGTALAAVEAAGDAADGIQLLLKVDAQGEEVDAVAGTGGGGDAAQHARVAVADHDGGVGELGELADLERQRAAGQIQLILVVVGKLPLGDDGRHGFSPFLKYNVSYGSQTI